MVGVKGRSGRNRKYDDSPYAERVRKVSLDYYYRHQEERKKYGRRRYRKIRDYSIRHNISLEEAIKRGAGRVKKVSESD